MQRRLLRRHGLRGEGVREKSGMRGQLVKRVNDTRSMTHDHTPTLVGGEAILPGNSTLSHPHRLITGVPRCYVLGPILFNIYIQPLLSVFDKYPHITYHSYADDIQIQLKITDPSYDITTINNCLTDIHDWLSLNSLSLTELFN